MKQNQKLIEYGENGSRNCFKRCKIQFLNEVNEDEIFVKNEENAECVHFPINDEIFIDASENEGVAIEELNLAHVTLKAAMTGDEAVEWMGAITEEIRGLINNDTREMVDRPNDKNVVTCEIFLRNLMEHLHE
ncbi:hypothetical protein WA026_006385 [Henosepilachna vigintioctopunctata]|uniref:PH domain-containing protein n=1 Tax=Henosepilachna vigintioctopunctata TaxID=420089 RepID=A0AAW1TI94_9CUCU